MLSINIIIKELKRLPQNRLEEVYHLVKSMNDPNHQEKDNIRMKIMEFKGLFSEMSHEDYNEYLDYLHETREDIFTRNPEI